MNRKLFNEMYKYDWKKICRVGKKRILSFLDELETMNWTYPKDENVFNLYLKRLYYIVRNEK